MTQRSTKSLRLLIKMENKNLDELTAAKNSAEEEVNKTVSKIELLRKQMEDEFYKYTGTEYAVNLEQYMSGAKKKLESFQEHKSAIEAQIQILQDKIFDVFTVLKKYEKLLEQYLEEEKSEHEQREQNDFDEMNSIRYSISMKEIHNENQ